MSYPFTPAMAPLDLHPSAQGGYSLRWGVSWGNAKTGAIPTAWPASRDAAWASCEGCTLRPDVAKRRDIDPCYAWDGNVVRGLGSVLRGAARYPARYTLAHAMGEAPRFAAYGRFGAIGDPARASRAEVLDAIATLRGEGMGVLAYTHFWWLADVERDLQRDFRASCDTPAAELAAHEAGWRTASLLPWDHEGPSFTTLDGRKGVVCPAQLRDLSCNQCGMCDPQGRAGAVPIGFVSHGSQARAARKRAGKTLPLAGGRA